MEISQKVKSLLDDTLERDGEIVFISYTMIDKTEASIRYVLEKALPESKKEYEIPLFSCIKELTTNAIKANVKQVLIKEKVVRNPTDKKEILTKLKSILKEELLLEYSLKTKEHGLSTRIYIRKEEDQLLVRVINPVPLNYEQLERISRKLNISKRYDSLAEYYLENPDPEAEGMGLGLSMVILLLKGSGMDSNLFRIYSDMRTKTIAELAIPLD